MAVIRSNRIRRTKLSKMTKTELNKDRIRVGAKLLNRLENMIGERDNKGLLSASTQVAELAQAVRDLSL